MSEASMFGKKTETNPMETEGIERGESMKSLNVSREQIEKIGNLFNGTYICTFIKAVAEGKTFRDANELAQQEYKTSGTDNGIDNNSGNAYGDIMTYVDNESIRYVLIDDHKGNFEFIYPSNSSVVDALDQLTQNGRQEDKK